MTITMTSIVLANAFQQQCSGTLIKTLLLQQRQVNQDQNQYAQRCTTFYRRERQQQQHQQRTITTMLKGKENDENSDNSNDDKSKLDTIQEFLQDKFPLFYNKILKDNDEIWKIISEDDDIDDGNDNGYTFFALNDDAVLELGEKRLLQLKDPRNLETIIKMGNYHFISLEAVPYQKLRTEDWTKPKPKNNLPRPLTIGSVKTLGGEIAVGREKNGWN